MIIMLASQLQNGQVGPPAEGAVMSAPTRFRYGGRMKISKKELAETLGISTRTINHWMAKRLLPYRRIGNIVFFDVAEVEQTLERYRHPAYGEPKRRMGRIMSSEPPTK